MRIFSFAYCNAADFVKIVMAPLTADKAGEVGLPTMLLDRRAR
jgi:hypothetical protein